MSCESDAIELLKRAGHKPTPQRLMVLGVVRHTPGHLTAAAIHDRVRRQYPYVDVSTVYRTLAVLKDLRLVNETKLGTGDATFEWAGEGRHHHLVCNNCGSIARLDDASLARLGQDLRREHGFVADLDHFAIFGTCRGCTSVPGAAHEGAVHRAAG